MRNEWMCCPLDWELSAADVLRLVRDDPHPIALLGAWAGGADIVAAAPVTTAADPFADVGPPRPARPRPARPRPEGGGPARFGAGWIGYLGFGAAAKFLPVPPAPGYPRRLPDAWWGFYDHVLRRDRATGQWFFEAPAVTDVAASRLAELKRRAARGSAGPRDYSCGPFLMTPPAAEHREAVRRAVDYIRQGDIFQADICLRLGAHFAGDPLDAFCAAAERLDPLYAAFLRVPGGALASLSPELFLRRKGSAVISSPIKGTRERPASPVAAQASRRALERSVKEGAENVMIVDLMRNDLSRVCLPGSVDVPVMLRAEPHPGVWHLVSDVTGTLAPGTGDEELIAATFPPGSVTGAPKVRALEIIHELEPVPREAYTGVIGYRSPAAGLELNVAIRTFEFHQPEPSQPGEYLVWLGSGGGVTARSDPAAEFRECLLKAAPLVNALGGTLNQERAAASGEALRPRPAAGVFTSVLVTGGCVTGLDEHLARLEASTVELYGKRLPAGVRSDLAARLAARPSGRLRVSARPVGGPLQVTVEIVPTGAADAAATLRPAVVPGGIGRHKWRDRRLIGDLARSVVPGEHRLLVDTNGDVLETDRGNVFAVVDGMLHTPPLDGRLLPGVTRAAVLRLALEHGIAVKEAPVSVDQLDRAAEVFVTNGVQGVVTVRPGPVTELLKNALAASPRQQTAARTAGLPPRLPRKRAGGTRPLVVLVDNYDSFTYNLAHLLAGSGCEVAVVRNDEVSAADIAGLRPAGIVISPGPCAPAEAGISMDVVRECGLATPLLGICLGHQAIAAAYGGAVIRAAVPAHGYASLVSHDGSGVLAGLPARFPAARYHSLVVDEAALPAALFVTARLGDRTVMGLRHATHPVQGLQFHPESILTVPHGQAIISNFVRGLGAETEGSWCLNPASGCR
jgi:para-aminobenzoate synthetase / 4-amino-4-deoxychorismate lyase